MKEPGVFKIAFFDIEGWEEKIAREAFPSHNLFFTKEKLNEYEGEKKDFDIISVFVSSEVTAEVLGKFPNLKLITTRSTGFDHINLGECKKFGTEVAFVPGYGNNTVAEFAFGLILNLTRKIYHAIDRIKEGGEFSFGGFRGIDLKGRTIGVIGTGRIGKEAIQIANGFGMKVLAFDPYPDLDAPRIFNFEYTDLDNLLSRSDVITIHAPYNESTHHLINMGNVGKIKKGAYLVNTARGGIVETQALIFALQEGILAGVGLDVLEEEGEIKDEMRFLKKSPEAEEMRTVLANHILMKMQNVLITPHNAFNTQEALERILKTTIENIATFLNDLPRGKSFIEL